MSRIWVPKHIEHADGEIVRDRLKGRRTNRIADQFVPHVPRASESEVKANPEKYYPQWYNPDRRPPLPVGLSADSVESFSRRLHAIHPDLEIVWHPLREGWQVYIKKPEITVWWTKGWKRLFFVPPVGSNMGLNELVFHRLYLIEPEVFGRAKVRPEVIEAEIERIKEKEDEAWDDEVRMVARDIWDYGNKITTAGRGNKVSQMYE